MSEIRYLTPSRNAPPAGDGVEMAIRGHRNTFAVLSARTKQSLCTKNPYLASAMGRITCSLKTSRKHSKILRRVMIKGTLSVKATATLKRGERQALEAFKALEITIKPYRRGWNTLPRDAYNMIEAVVFEQERRCIDPWLIIEVSKLAEGACVEYAPIRDELLQRECVITAIQGVAGVRESEIEFTRTQIGHHATDEWLLNVDAAEDRWPDEGNPDHDLQTSSEREALSITSDYLIDMMNTPVSDRDIAMLVFHWTTLSRCNKYERLQSSRKPWQDVRKKDCGDRETS
ncbi:hypothetical protein AUEXF2481DRAFT_91038 [Aureobasidium subglaciale EXF-2481]|uniref:Uncharacterized protein n=1 Tax=Aureobasidium subglaciale (strain EXF-2481) TaxID=1043005 RepID=A0A074Y4E5_AURSE|nr:uncharacterized protein AUEXF2481DRAFT_91038 [Aureobasidium subglaciale EXF-2481]KAI5210886.1 hypothetical protein E4T38_01875 [Aureobasidium subglaciale]KAI5229349.1 hypothetical protein E4T40_01605 [Aureobasidium subglaciale]KAI5232913.1 hypothetical protein E4T41_01873 [Aureobasidium subglaciale]KAI5266366.1 hypothetical protein E4T46_01602 [Aureobasidium subglaciale]KEQ92628.1 hypothetical protein AUEXF2481DRAFT_91038 [Aureobasidium subglaciale EXF-2481]